MSKRINQKGGFYETDTPILEGDGAEVDDDIHPSAKIQVEQLIADKPRYASVVKKDKEVKATKKTKNSPIFQETTETPAVNQAVVVQVPAMTLIQKVQLMSSLTEVLSDQALKKSIESKTNGHLVYQILQNAVEKELAKMFGSGDDEETASTVANHIEGLTQMVARLDSQLHSLSSVSAELKNQPVLEIFKMVASKLGGSNG